MISREMLILVSYVTGGSAEIIIHDWGFLAHLIVTPVLYGIILYWSRK